MQKHFVRIYIVLILLIVGGAAINPNDLTTLMASDPWTYTLRSLLMLAWLYVGFFAGAKNALIRGSLFFLGGLYAIIGILALFNSTVWGINPHPLVGFELWLHIIYGVAALTVAFASRNTSLDQQK